MFFPLTFKSINVTDTGSHRSLFTIFEKRDVLFRFNYEIKDKYTYRTRTIITLKSHLSLNAMLPQYYGIRLNQYRTTQAGDLSVRST